jgi:ATP phosphoribosyltransferase
MDPSKIVLAIPKKGPLSPQTLSLLESAHITYTRHPRLDIAYSSTLPIILAFLPASDIPQFVAQENVDFGICGDVDISESGLSSQLTRVLGLGYGKCALDVQVQTFPTISFMKKVPMKSPLTSLKDMNDVRVATTHDRIVSTHFPRTKIQYISGSVDVACAVCSLKQLHLQLVGHGGCDCGFDDYGINDAEKEFKVHWNTTLFRSVLDFEK